MASRKPRSSQPAPSRPNRANVPFQIPFGMPDLSMDAAMDDFLGGDDGDMNDEDLEAELNALMSGSDIRSRPPRGAGVSPQPARGAPSPQGKGPPMAPPRRSKGSTPNPALVPPVLLGLDLKDIEKIGMDEGHDDDEDIDEDDPELLAELADLTPDEVDDMPVPARTEVKVSPARAAAGHSPLVTLLLERLENYEGAKQEAVDGKEAGKVRRYERAIKTIKEQIGEAKKGQPVAEEDIPPPIFVKSVLQKPLADSKPFPSVPSNLAQQGHHPAVAAPKEAPPSVPPVPPRPSPQAPAAAPVKEENFVLLTLKSRREEYRHAALEAKRAENKKDAMRFMTVAKQFDVVIEAAERGEELDLSEMPPHPSELPPESPGPVKTAPEPPRTVPPRAPAPVAGDDDIPEIDPADAKMAFHAPDAPKTVLEALQQRLQKYKSTAEEAQKAGDASRARRMQRIVKQYQDAIKDVQAKRPVDFAELPTPPGFGPIPTSVAAGRPSAAPAAAAAGVKPAPKPALPAAAHGRLPHATTRESRNEQQYQLLNERHKQLKLAALKAKKEGAVETAKHYLRQAKGLEPMIEASANGLPVDLAAVPKAPPGFASATAGPSERDGFEVVGYEEAGAHRPANQPGSRAEVFVQLEKELVAQVQMCVRNAAHFHKSGDIPMAERFDKFNQHARKDLEALRNAFKHALPVPKFHYETRVFSVVKCCPELPDNVMELTILRGFGYSLPGFAPADFTSYVKWDFPFPAEAPQSKATTWIKGTNEPEYNATFPLQINRKSRALARIMKSKGINCEIYVKMGFLKADKVLATVQIPLEALETHCVLHGAFNLMNGKQAAGGKLEVRVRLREPIVKPEVEELREKWLVIDQFVR
ncbi:coiled-coil and C2 domain-containing protein 1-like [Paramacrobiotus metropolitanus]|uniref:coiled-coil and C2 domain-containing protein 1-like n=1 Tax=Paramacrobiotus metropolitanus TaxID=2943436 RepID=UPI0024464A3A|nr:coiled-coil and C2 domain-containing protein 1-like [Paramacrobiotus metropolitanus]